MKKIISQILLLLISSISFAQNTQTIRGRIIDEASKSAIVGATIQVTDIGNYAAISNDDGFFKIINVPIGRRSLKISLIGYEPQFVNNVLLTTGKELEINIQLLEKVNNLAEAEVLYKKSENKSTTNNEMASVSARSFNIEDTKKYAGALGDPSRMAQNFAGVIGANDSRNDIVVRGNSPNGMLWQMEGLNMPNPNHFGSINSTGGPVSILNNNNLNKSDFMTSAFPAQYGNALAGVFDLRLRNGNTNKPEYIAQVGFNGFEFGAEGPFAKNSKSSYLINYRYSTLGIFKQLGIDFGTGSATPIYQDVNYKFNWVINKKSSLSLFGFAGNSSVNFLGNEVDTTLTDLYSSDLENVKVRFSSSFTGLKYDYQLTNKTNLNITAGISTSYQRFLGDSISYLTREEFKSGDAKFNTLNYLSHISLSHKLNAKNSIVVGVMNDLNTFNLKNINYFAESTIEQIIIDRKDQYVVSQVYAQWKHRFNEKLSLNTGLHSQMISLNNNISIEPRLGLRYLLDATKSLSLGYGLHSQSQNVYTYFVQTPIGNDYAYTNKDLDFTKSHHYVLSYDQSINEFFRIKAEVYYQSIYNAPIENKSSSFSALNTGADFDPVDVDSLINNGIGENYGVELTLERFFNKGYYFLFTTSLFDSKYRGADGVWRNTAFNTNYVFNFLAGKEFNLNKKGNVLAFNIKLTSTGGKYLTPIDFAKSEQAKQAVFIRDKAFSEKQSDYFRTDIKIAYRKEFKKSSMEFSVDLQNVTNNKNVFQQTYNPRSNSIVTEYQQGFFPVPTFRFTF